MFLGCMLATGLTRRLDGLGIEMLMAHATAAKLGFFLNGMPGWRILVCHGFSGLITLPCNNYQFQLLHLSADRHQNHRLHIFGKVQQFLHCSIVKSTNDHRSQIQFFCL